MFLKTTIKQTLKKVQSLSMVALSIGLLLSQCVTSGPSFAATDPGMTAKATQSISTQGKAPKIPILLYHHFDPKKQSNSTVVSPAKFEEDLIALKKAGYTTIHFSQLIDSLNGKETLPPKPIIITMDDGYSSNYRYAYPLLKKYNMKASFFVIGWSAGKSSFENTDEEINAHFSWQEAGEMSSSGLVEIQSHSYDLHSEAGLSNGQGLPVGKGISKMESESDASYGQRILTDLAQNNQLIEAATGKPSTIFAYPMGIRTMQSDWLLQDGNFFGGLTTVKGVRYYHSLADLRAMPRLNVDMSVSSKTLAKWIEAQSIK